MKKYVFHYNGSEAGNHDEQRRYYESIGDNESLTEHELLSREDGKPCSADLDTKEWVWINGKSAYVVEAFFEDGNELNVYVDELTEIEEA